MSGKTTKKSKVVIARITNVEPYLEKVVDLTALFDGDLERMQMVLRRRELVVPDEGVLLRSTSHSQREGKSAYFIIKWMPAQGINRAFALVHEGFMTKKSILSKKKNNWKTRYFRLWRRVAAGDVYSEPVLQYYKKMNAKKPTGELRLCKGSSVEFHSMALSGKKGFGLHLKVCGKKNKSGMISESKSLFAYTEQKADILLWIKSIKEELTLYHYDGRNTNMSQTAKHRIEVRAKSPQSPFYGGTGVLVPSPEARSGNHRDSSAGRDLDFPRVKHRDDGPADTGAPCKVVALELPSTFRYDERLHKGIDFTGPCDGSIRLLNKMVSDGRILIPRDTGLIAKSKTMTKKRARPVYYHVHYPDELGKAAHDSLRNNQFPESMEAPERNGYVPPERNAYDGYVSDRSNNNGLVAGPPQPISRFSSDPLPRSITANLSDPRFSSDPFPRSTSDNSPGAPPVRRASQFDNRFSPPRDSTASQFDNRFSPPRDSTASQFDNRFSPQRDSYMQYGQNPQTVASHDPYRGDPHQLTSHITSHDPYRGDQQQRTSHEPYRGDPHQLTSHITSHDPYRGDQQQRTSHDPYRGDPHQLTSHITSHDPYRGDQQQRTSHEPYRGDPQQQVSSHGLYRGGDQHSVGSRDPYRGDQHQVPSHDLYRGGDQHSVGSRGYRSDPQLQVPSHDLYRGGDQHSVGSRDPHRSDPQLQVPSHDLYRGGDQHSVGSRGYRSDPQLPTHDLYRSGDQHSVGSRDPYRGDQHSVGSRDPYRNDYHAQQPHTHVPHDYPNAANVYKQPRTSNGSFPASNPSNRFTNPNAAAAPAPNQFNTPMSPVHEDTRGFAQSKTSSDPSLEVSKRNFSNWISQSARVTKSESSSDSNDNHRFASKRALSIKTNMDVDRFAPKRLTPSDRFAPKRSISTRHAEPEQRFAPKRSQSTKHADPERRFLHPHNFNNAKPDEKPRKIISTRGKIRKKRSKKAAVEEDPRLAPNNRLVQNTRADDARRPSPPSSPERTQAALARELIRTRPRSTTDDMHLSMVMVSPGKNPTTPMARDTNPSTDDRQLGYDPPPPQPEEIDRRPSFVPPLKPQDKEPRLSYVPSPPKDKQDRRASYIPPPPPKDKEGRRGSYIPPPPPKDKGGRRTSYIPPPPPKDKGGRRASYVPPPPPKVKGIEGNRRFVQAPIDKHSSKSESDEDMASPPPKALSRSPVLKSAEKKGWSNNMDTEGSDDEFLLPPPPFNSGDEHEHEHEYERDAPPSPPPEFTSPPPEFVEPPPPPPVVDHYGSNPSPPDQYEMRGPPHPPVHHETHHKTRSPPVHHGMRGPPPPPTHHQMRGPPPPPVQRQMGGPPPPPAQRRVAPAVAGGGRGGLLAAIRGGSRLKKTKRKKKKTAKKEPKRLTGLMGDLQSALAGLGKKGKGRKFPIRRKSKVKQKTKKKGRRRKGSSTSPGKRTFERQLANQRAAVVGAYASEDDSEEDWSVERSDSDSG